MSFANESKKECLMGVIENDCCAIAFLCAVIKCSGQLNYSLNERVIEIFTEIDDLFEKINKIIKQYYGVECELEMAEDMNIARSTRYRITIPFEIADKVIMDLGLCANKKNDTFMDTEIPDFIIAEDCCKRAFIKGAYVASATSNILIKSYDNITKNTSGYHLEFVFGFSNLAKSFQKLLSVFDIPSKITIRKNCPLVYIKEYQKICDVLALVGAFKSVLALQNEVSIRNLRNNINRQTNCMNANIGKTVSASIKQLNAINYIIEEVGLDSLSQELMELCLLRIANPDESLENLSKLYPYKLTKSGINHRFSKIIKYAESLHKNKFSIRQL